METKRNLKEEYLRQSVMTATPSELLVMLYDGCIRNLKLAELAMEAPADYMKVNERMVKAQKIISELIGSLDMSYEISTQLLPIYDYLLRTLRTMNVKKDLSQLPTVLEILKAQRDTWEQVSLASGGETGRQACI